MPRPGLVLLVALGAGVPNDEVEAWVRSRLAAQRGQPASTAPAPTLWRERAPGAQPVLPGFQPPTSLAPLVKAVRPGVVNIGTRNEGTSRSLGSGFLITPDGLVVTNNHVVEKAHEIAVHLSDGRSFEATEVGRDPSTDLALLRLAGAEGLPTVELGDSDQLEVGDWVVAIGNPFGLDTSVTHGIISASERVLGLGPYDDFIQTNALINPGNSGGPLFDMRGAVVGVTTAIVSQGQGIGFAVPINLVKGLLPNLLDNGRPERGWLGLNVLEVGEGATQAPVVVDVYEDSPALKAGIRPGDKVLAVAGRPVQRYQQILRRVALLAPGTAVKLELERNRKVLEVTAVLVARPSEQAARAIASGRVDQLGLVLKVLDGRGEPGGKEGSGLRVEALLPGSPVEAAGLQPGDVLVEVNRVHVDTLEELEAALAQYGKTEVVLVRVRRGDSLRYVALKPRP